MSCKNGARSRDRAHGGREASRLRAGNEDGREHPVHAACEEGLALAGKEAKALQHSYVGTEHILLGLLREGEGVAARVLKSLEVDIERTRNEILKELDPNFAQSEEGGEAIPSEAGGKKEGKTPALRAFGRDLTESAKKGELDPWWAAPTRSSASFRSSAAARRTIPSSSVKPVWARRRSPRA